MNKGEIVLAGGCFWGTEAYLGRLPGIIQTEVGYANSRIPQPSYEEVCLGETGAAEPYHQNYLDANPSGYCHVNLADASDFVSEHPADFAIAQHDYSKPADA